ncbi:MAG TPA: hypothetical protein DCP69_12435 [Candidatus Omnitrophica bacterium]|nr:hypothetical protein [Candidatus Omnitrophota bacterium]
MARPYAATKSAKPCRRCDCEERYLKGGDCIQCARERSNKYRTNLKTRPLALAAMRRWFQNNREYVRAQQKAHQRNPKVLAYQKAYRERHRERMQSYLRAYYLNNREHLIAASRAYRELHVEAYRRRGCEWQKANKERHNHNASAYRARKLRAPGSHSVEQWEVLKEAYSYRCAYCLCKRPLTRDHVVPLTLGGSDSIENILPACQQCNSRKHTKTPDEFAEWMVGAVARTAPRKG